MRVIGGSGGDGGGWAGVGDGLDEVRQYPLVCSLLAHPGKEVYITRL